MAIWELWVYNPDGSFRKLLTPEDPVDEIQYSLRGDGDCLDAVIRGVGLDLRPRDIVSVRCVTSAELGGLPLVRYWGWVVHSADSRDPEVAETRLVGGSQRLRETLVTWGRLPPYTDVDEWDVAELARYLFDRSPFDRVPVPLPPLVTTIGSYMRQQGFSTGPRTPRLESIADTLDALRDMVPGFTVEAGSSYTYGGTTYEAGEEVPATTWGVRAHHSFISDGAYAFFSRWDGLLELDEVDDKVWAEWTPLSSEVVVDRVHVVLFDQPLEGTAEVRSTNLVGAPYEPVGVEVVAAGSDYHAAQLVTVPVLEGLEVGGWSGSASSSGVVNISRAFDSDPTTYAHNSGSASRIQINVRALTSTRALRITYSSFVPLTVRFMMRHGSPIGLAEYRATFDATDGEQRRVVMLCPRVEGAPTDRPEVEFYAGGLSGEDQIRLYDLRALRVNEDALERVGRSHLKLPAEFAGELTVPGQVLQPQPRVQLTLSDDSVVTAKGERYDYAITRDGGLTTRVRLNQALPADGQSESEALTRRLHEVTLAARRA